MKDIILKAENISKKYRLGQVGTGTLPFFRWLSEFAQDDDGSRWWDPMRGKENPYLKIGDTNDCSIKVVWQQ